MMAHMKKVKPAEQHRNKPIDIQHTDEGMLLPCGLQGGVDAVNDPAEQAGVDVFGQSISTVNSVHFGDWLDVRLCSRLYFFVTEPVGHFFTGNSQQLTEHRQVSISRLEMQQCTR